MSHALSTEGLRDLAREFRLPMTIYTASDSLEPAQAIDPRMIYIPVEDEEITLPTQFLDIDRGAL